MVYWDHADFLRKNGGWSVFQVDHLNVRARLILKRNLVKCRAKIGRITMKPKA